MAHYKRCRPRTAGTRKSTSRGLWHNHHPRWWDIIHHTRRRRAAEHTIERKIIAGLVDPDGVAWPLGNSKPHEYYW